jgi:glycosyltransferase involved in cell wall biosynthesis
MTEAAAPETALEPTAQPMAKHEAPAVPGQRDRAADMELLRRCGLFDIAYYLATYPDIAASNVDPLEHFFDYGFLEDRRPNPYFDPSWYLAVNQDVRDAGLQPLLHYAIYGDREGRRPCELFDTAWYRKHYGIADDELALAHYLARATSCTVSPISEFDVDYYADRYTDVVAARIDPFHHFIHYGYREGRNPSADFDTRFYADRYCGGSLDTNPFLHFLAHKGEPGIHGRVPPDEITVARELRRLTQPGPEFEEFAPLADHLTPSVKLLAFYLPQFHAFKENDEWWGKGFTEWSNIVRGTPRFAGHYQPRVPRDLGFYTLDRLEPMLRQIEMAKTAGIHGFVFYHYWFNGRRLMEGPVERFLAAPEAKMPFCLMWANESWTRRWDGTESEVLISQDYQPDDDAGLAAEFARHFADPRYIRVAGRPLLMIYRPGLIPDGAAAIARWRAIFSGTFGENPLIIMAQSFNDCDPTAYGLDGAVEFPPHKLTANLKSSNLEYALLDQEFEGKIMKYDEVVQVSLEEPAAPYPLIKTAFPSWDNDARRQGHGVIIAGSTPAKYEDWLGELAKRAQENTFYGEKFVCINAWNEWCEGAYLEPDLHYGAAYLNATGRAVTRLSSQAGNLGLLLVGHDAFPSGAQHLLLNIGRTLKRQFAVPIAFLLLGDGKMEGAYAQIAPLTVAATDAEIAAAALAMARLGFRRAIVNTSAAGRALPYLTEVGIECVTLVHELPRILHEKKLLDSARAVLSNSQRIVFPARFVQNQFLGALDGAPDDRMVIIPQGVYQNIAFMPEAGLSIRQELGLAADDRLVVGAGYADMRKGFDLFIQLWRLLQREESSAVHLAWIGDIDPELSSWLAPEIAAAREAGTFHMMGYRNDIAAFFNAADAYALTSREDPFPSVILEALSVDLPCFVFDLAGGIPDLFRETGIGTVVPYADVLAMAEAIAEMLSTAAPGLRMHPPRQSTGPTGDFPQYVDRLLTLAAPSLPRISVAVPNSNYAHHLPERLNSIFAQSHPVHEVIVLDDASTDASVTVIKDCAAVAGRDIRLILNERNAGSVFEQWRKAAEAASGEFLWIAEADDLSDPEFLAKTVAMMAADPDIQLAFCDSRAVDGQGREIYNSYKGYYASVAGDALETSQVFDAATFAGTCLSVKNLLLNVSGVVWRRAALLRALANCAGDLKSFRVAGDWLLYLTAVAVPGARIAYLAEPLNTHRRHEASVTHSLAAGSHLAEIASCHAVARRNFRLEPQLVTAQNDYLGELRVQFGLSRSAELQEVKIIANPPELYIAHSAA